MIEEVGRQRSRITGIFAKAADVRAVIYGLIGCLMGWTIECLDHVFECSIEGLRVVEGGIE